MSFLSTLFLALTTLLSILPFSLQHSASTITIHSPSCESVFGAPTYRKCKIALDSFIHTVTVTRDYTLDERIEFLGLHTGPRHPELPSELLIPEHYTFMSSDPNTQPEGRICILNFGTTSHNSQTLITTFSALNSSASSIIELCVKGLRGTGGTALISSSAEDEDEFQLGPTVFNGVGDRLRDHRVMEFARNTLVFEAERGVLGGGTGGTATGGGAGSATGGTVDSGTMPGQANYCDSSKKDSCWAGFECEVIKFLDGVREVFWGLSVSEGAGFIGRCVLEN
ncbi:MAG: hypothetical protein M1812_006694 [Candelaria pacifica]|nr:MAG: hypothetical protein M1812_006694 [Candelaria pacifica]